MLTMEGLIAVISLYLTALGLGYAIGSKDNNTPQKDGIVKYSGVFRWNHSIPDST